MKSLQKDIGPDIFTDKMARDELVLNNLPQVKWIANRIAGHFSSAEDMEDLMVAGIIGLIDAAKRYDSSRDNKFMTYATFRIRGAILSELRSRDFVSRSTRKKIRNLEEASMKLEQESGHVADDEEIARELNIDVDKVRETRKMAHISFVSIDEINGSSSRTDKENMLHHLIGEDTNNPFDLISLKEMEATLAEVIEELPKKEQLVLSMYYWDELTMKEIGKVLDITESRVSQIHSKAIRVLRSKLRDRGLLNDET